MSELWAIPFPTGDGHISVFWSGPADVDFPKFYDTEGP